MSALASLLVRDQVVSVRKIEEAIQRQVISGGDLDTVLLDMGIVAENVMSAYRAAMYALLPATREEIMNVSREVVRLVPKEVAERHRLIPLSAEDTTVVVAVAEPLTAESEEQLAFLLGFDLVQRIATEARVGAALAHHYGAELPSRLRRVADKLRDRDPGVVPYVKPPEETRIDPSRADMPRKDDEAAFFDGEPDDDEPEDVGTDRFGVALAPAGGRNARASQDQWQPDPAAQGPERGPGVRGEARGPDEPAPAPPSGMHGEGVGVAKVLGIGRQARRPRSSPPPPRSTTRTGAPPPSSDSPHRARRSSRPASALLRRERGPLSARKTVELLNKADNRDEILEILFFFARQFFDYTALFVVHEELAEGRQAFGPGADTERVERMAVPLDVPGSFGAVHRTGAPAITRLDAADLDRLVARDLEREGAQPALLIPIAIRKRVVLILYGDRDGDAFGVEDVPELVGLAPRVSEAFERIILRRKYRGYGSSAEPTGEARLDASRMGALQGDSEPSSGPWQAGARDEPGSQPAHGRVAQSAPSQRARKRTVMGLPTAPPPERSPEGGAPAPASSEPEAVGSQDAGTAGRQARPAAFSVLRVPRSAPPPPGPEPSAGNDAQGTRYDAASPEPDGGPAAPTIVSDGAAPSPASEPAGDGWTRADASPPAEERPAHKRRRQAAPPPRGLDGSRPPPDAGLYSVHRPSAEAVGPKRPPAPHPDSEPPGVVHGRTGSTTDAVAEPAGRDRGQGHHDLPQPEVIRVGHNAQPVVDHSSGPEQPSGPGQSTLPYSTSQPKVIVDMGDSVDALVRELCACGPDDEEAAVRALLNTGEAALPVLAQYFPGPLWFNRHEPHRRLPRGCDISAIARALVAYGEQAVPYVSSLLGGGDEDIRFYAILVASELVHPALVPALGRCIFDSDPGVRALVLDVLRLFRDFDEELEPVLDTLRNEARLHKNANRRCIAVRALGELRDNRALSLLVELLRDEDQRLVEAAHRSLVLLTRQDFGTSQRRWQNWVERNGHRHRIEWLIDALLHGDVQIRTAAAEELKQITQQYYGYHPSSPKRDREVAQKKYREWWQSDGRARFGR